MFSVHSLTRLGGADSLPDWVGGEGSAYMAFTVLGGEDKGRALFVGFSCAGSGEAVSIPPPPPGTEWRRVVDTGISRP